MSEKENKSFSTFLTADLKRKIVAFLDGNDAQRLSGTCRTNRSDLCLTTFKFNAAWVWDFKFVLSADMPQCGPQIPILALNETLTITLVLDLIDLHLKNIYIVGHTQNCNSKSKNELLFSNGRIICDYDMGTIRKDKIRVSFQPRQHEIFHIWYKARYTDEMEFGLKIFETIFDNENHCLANAYGVLHDNGMILRVAGNQQEEQTTQLLKSVTFSLEMLTSVMQTLLIQLQTKEKPALDLSLSQFLQAKGIKLDEDTLSAMLKLTRRLQSFKYESFGRLPREDREDDLSYGDYNSYDGYHYDDSDIERYYNDGYGS